MNKQTSRTSRSKKVISTSNEQRKVDLLAKVRVARKDGKQLTMPPKYEGYDLIVNPSTHEEFIFLANELLEWVKYETSNNINDFAISKKISPYRFKRFDNDYFQECLETAKYIIASRNRFALIKRQFNEKLYFEELPELNRDYREYREQREDKKILGLKESLGNITIVDHMLEKE
jgi:hypothetical protein